jgi:phosphate acyltransferase
MRIALDVMGGDHGPDKVIRGGLEALTVHSSELTQLFLVGQRSVIEEELSRSGVRNSKIEIIHADEVLEMGDKPILAVRGKKGCSITKAVQLVADGEADAMVSPGNTGGVVTASTIKLRPSPGVDRPAIATVIPTHHNEFVLLDSGANIDAKPIHLAHQAIMGSIYSRDVLGYAKPRVGILTVGTEDTKGNDLTLEAFKLCRKLPMIDFIGNVEGHDLFKNRVDVVVCDGFVGNVVLKTCEGIAKNIFQWLKTELTASPIRKIGAFLARKAFLNIKTRTDSDNYGGAPLLGLNGAIMIAHGSAEERAIKNAIACALRTVHLGIQQSISQEIQQANQLLIDANKVPSASASASASEPQAPPPNDPSTTS